MPDMPPEAVRLALAARAHALIDRPTPTALSDERLTEMMLEAAAPVLVADCLKAAAKETFEDAIRAATDEATGAKLAEIEAAVRTNERERIAALHDSHEVIWMPPAASDGKPRPACRQCTARYGDERTFTPWPCLVLLGRATTAGG